MDIFLDWHKAIGFSKSHKNGMYEVALDKIPEAPGVYIVRRGHGDAIEALYVGLATNLRSRIKQQLNNHRLMRHVENAKTGARGVIVGEWRARPGQTSKKCLPLIERSLIRHFVLEGHDLVNKNGTSLRQHKISSTGRPVGLFPLRMYVDRR